MRCCTISGLPPFVRAELQEILEVVRQLKQPKAAPLKKMAGKA